MREHLKKYVELLFAGSENTDDMQQEILQNTLDRYDDLIAQGKTPEAAYQLAISGIGDVQEIVSPPIASEPPTSAPTASEPKKAEKPIWKRILQAIGIGLYILSALPLLVLQNEIGLCGLLSICAVATVFMVLGAGGIGRGQKTGVKKVFDIILTVMCLVAYLLVSFWTGAWIVSWLLFPLFACVKGFVFAIIDLILHTVVRGKAIVRIVIFSILIPVVAYIASAALTMNTSIIHFGPNQYQQVTETQTVCLDADTVSRLSIDWVSGNVDIQTADTEEISFRESGTPSNWGRLTWRQSGDTLSIRHEKLFFGSFVHMDKDLTVIVPESWFCKELDISTVSGKVTVTGLSGQEAEADGVSAELIFSGCSFADVSLSTVSGDCTLDLSSATWDVEADSVSGTVTVNTAACPGFTARLDSASGDLHSQLATTKDGKTHVYGDGQCQIDVDTISGDLYLE